MNKTIGLIGLAGALLIQIFCRTPLALAAPQVGLDLSCGSNVAISECSQSVPNTILAGGTGLLDIHVDIRTPEFEPSPFRGLSRSWPTGLIIEAGYISGSDWMVIPGLATRLHLQRWNWASALREDSLWKATGKEMSSLSTDTTWRFTFEVPEDLTGRQLFFKATYTHRALGILVNPVPELSTISRNRLTVVAPCSQVDRDRARGSAVFYSEKGGDYLRAVAIADSLIAIGWTDLAGLEAATQAAGFLRQPQKSLEYLELNYSTNHRISFFSFSQPLTPDKEAEKYQQKRQQLMHVIQERNEH
jgi:hypothetical protein